MQHNSNSGSSVMTT